MIHRFLLLKIIDQWKVIKNAADLLQGNNFSSMCADILLNEFYQLLYSRGIRFVRNADDCMICISERAVHGISESKTKFIDGKLFLQVNHDKSKIDRLGIPPSFQDLVLIRLRTAGRYPFTRRVETNSQRRCRNSYEKKP